MAHSQAAKVQTHKRILRVAAERLRQTGIDRLSIANLMKEERFFLAEGAYVAITGPNQKTLHAAAAELGNRVLAIQADATDVEATERAIAAAAEKFAKLNIVFANAGIGSPTPVGQTSQAAFDETIRTNLTAVFFTVQAAATHLNEGAPRQSTI
jgi:NAD(P)-dependent dehydrogenase (short-subunit alcohol dehydrogenase family)